MDTQAGLLHLYANDEHAWLASQAAALEDGRLGDVDRLNLAEFLRSMSRSEEREVRSRLAVVLQHLLKLRYQPERSTSSWTVTLITRRGELNDILDHSATLRRVAAEQVEAAYARGRRLAAAETRLPPSTFPAACPWTLAEVLDESGDP